MLKEIKTVSSIFDHSEKAVILSITHKESCCGHSSGKQYTLKTQLDESCCLQYHNAGMNYYRLHPLIHIKVAILQKAYAPTGCLDPKKSSLMIKIL